MMALTIKQPWAEFILGGVKRVENRVWGSTYRGVLLIHASQKFDEEWRERLPTGVALQKGRKYYDNLMIKSWGGFNWQKGQIIGAVIMTECDMVHNDAWCEYGCWYHRYVEPRKFRKGIAAVGRMKLFEPKGARTAMSHWDRKEIDVLNQISTEIYNFEEMV